LAYASQSVKEPDSGIYKSLVEFCLENKFFDLAELFCIRLLLCNQKGWWAYNQLKNISQTNVITVSDNTQDVRKLSIDLLKRYFPSSEFNSVCSDKRSDKSVLSFDAFDEAETNLTGPVNISNVEFRAYSHKKIKSRKAFTLEIENGKLWFDGFNFVVWDREGNVISDVSTGNCELVDIISKTRSPNKIDGSACLLGGRISSNYYHWMYDSIPRICVLEKSGVNRSNVDRYVVTGVTKPFQRETLEKLGIDHSKIYSTFESGYYITADKLYIPSYGSNENLIRNRCSPGDNLHLLQGKWASDFLRDELLTKRSDEKSGSEKYVYISRGKNKYVYISRGKNDSRNFSNEREIVDLLESRGFEVIDPQQKSVVEQAEYFSNAKVIIAAHGAALTNTVFCKPGTRIIELHGPFTASCFWIVSQYMGLEHYTYLTDESRKSIKKLHGQNMYSSLEQFRLKPLHLALNELSGIIDLALDHVSDNSDACANVA